jgi:hypothetical protein
MAGWSQWLGQGLQGGTGRGLCHIAAWSSPVGLERLRGSGGVRRDPLWDGT